jgi:hypothetical protein
MVHWTSCRAWTESRALLTTVNAPIVAHAINELALQKRSRDLIRPSTRLRMGACHG